MNPLIVILASAQLVSGCALLIHLRRGGHVKRRWWGAFIALQLVSASAAIIAADAAS